MLYRYTVAKEQTIFARCLETVTAVSEHYVDGLNVALVKKEQKAEFSDVRKMVVDKGEFLVGDDGLLYRVVC